MRTFNFLTPFGHSFRIAFYEGEGGNNAQGAGTAAGNSEGNGGASPPPPPPPPPAAGSGGLNFNTEQQNHINRLLAEERRKTQEQARTANQKTIQELETLKQNQNLTQQEKDSLQRQIEELQNQYRTKEEQQQTEYTKLQKKYNDDTKVLTTERDTWKNRFERRVITVDLRDAAKEHKAVDPEQIEALLGPKTTVVEELIDGKPTGNLVSRVRFTGRGQDGKPVQLDLSPSDAVKAMKEWPEKYGNLFESESRGGLGQNNSGGAAQNAGGGIPDLERMSPQDYQKNRQKIREQMLTQSSNGR